MEVNLTLKIDETRKLYRCEARGISEGKLTTFSTLIIATNSEEASAKLKEHLIQERPSFDLSKLEIQISIEYMLT